jgi:glycosyltransferase involved in cell wall biosynthesis
VALGFVPHLAERLPVYLLHEGCPDSFLDSKLTVAEAGTYRRLQRTDTQRSIAATKNSIVIEHGAACLARKFSAAHRPRYMIARVMTEGVLARDQAACMLSRGFDEYWVPTNYHVQIFVEAGIPPDKLLVVPEPVDTDFFDPREVSAKDIHGWRASAAVAAGLPAAPAVGDVQHAQPFVFCSVFKWEARKGWDALISAYATLAKRSLCRRDFRQLLRTYFNPDRRLRCLISGIGQNSKHRRGRCQDTRSQEQTRLFCSACVATCRTGRLVHDTFASGLNSMPSESTQSVP